MINASLFSAAVKQKEVVREDGERRKTVIHEKGPAHVCECMRVCLCVRACVCLAVMTLCLWAVYLPQQRKAKKKKWTMHHSHRQTDTHTLSPFLSFALIASLLYSHFHTHAHKHTHTCVCRPTHLFHHIKLLSSYFNHVSFSLPLLLQYGH